MIQAPSADDTIPAALRDRLSAALAELAPRAPSADGGAGHAAAPDGALACLSAGEALLERVLRADSASRQTALDLLAADALVTRAFERAADRPETLPALAGEAMRRIARLAGTAG